MNHIILVEDDYDDVYFFKSANRNSASECEVSVFRDGAELLDFIYDESAYNSVGTPLIFLDLNLPKVSGLEVLSKLKQDGKLNKLPIIVYTTSTFQKDIEMAYELGAKSYITKKASIELLSDLLTSANEYWFNYCELPKVH
ncbi:response regulator [Psychrosphaera haliotis]|uniref:Response regulator n=1 Tax=Psychrosphaera haliotis TaxID=555083 RepID=A0A6N8F9M9_9GAMM|nr:response regulator [Psychrosphaera haliotis]MUH72978.1 response regulator [Psychrosphaera haliotis]